MSKKEERSRSKTLCVYGMKIGRSKPGSVGLFLRAGQNRDKFLLGGIQWVSSLPRYKCVLLLWKHTEIEIMVWGFSRSTERSFRLPVRLYLSTSLTLLMPDIFWYYSSHTFFSLIWKMLGTFVVSPCEHFSCAARAAEIPPEYGAYRPLNAALCTADVSHTANSNTRLMLLYETTNERTKNINVETSSYMKWTQKGKK